ncbi:hypothetical protein DFJ73DRAFT_959461 [Zopfochytrium polystomum]|nr:hypothetical protein DFJ73DRAFT_959461 [Zopfochytrium polystomum]
MSRVPGMAPNPPYHQQVPARRDPAGAQPIPMGFPSHEDRIAMMNGTAGMLKEGLSFRNGAMCTLMHALSIPGSTIQTTWLESSRERSVQTDLFPTNGSCFCCDNLLRFPENVPCFRCTVCETVNDLRPIPPPPEGSSAERLTLTLVAALLRVRPESDDHDTSAKIIGESFAYHDTLNESFPTATGIPSLTDPGINLDEVRMAYELIITSRPSVVAAMMYSTDKILKRPGRRLLRNTDIKFLMIILENPLLSNRSTPEELNFHHDILARTFGLMSCLLNALHDYVVNWFARLPLDMFEKRVELVNHFITVRINKEGMRDKYPRDWGIKSAARVMALLFAANLQRKDRIHVSNFYNTAVDSINLIRDYAKWQEVGSGYEFLTQYLPDRSSSAFSFCQYPFLVSLGGKLQIMAEDAKKQMTDRFREAFYRTAIDGHVTDPFLSLHVRRHSLIEDSLNQLQSRHIDLKKKLRIEFVNEDGVDAGGLTKEWFFLLIRDLFHPLYGMFVFDEDSLLCWFNVASLENHEEYRLVGIVVGLAIYNSTILDVHLPLACFKKLRDIPVNLEDLKLMRPVIGRSLEQLLEYEGDDLEAVFCRDFIAEYEAFGATVRVPLVPNGENIPVTQANKREFVDRYVSWVLNESIEKQFESFREGFNNVCSGNALSLFRPEEIEMMVRGGNELDIQGLESVTEYEGFRPDEPIVRHFWDIFTNHTNEDKRKLLLFITGTDRIPATGIQNMAFKITCLGEDSDRLPISHTCFNQLCIPRYRTREKLEQKLMKAVEWSAGFHVK